MPLACPRRKVSTPGDPGLAEVIGHQGILPLGSSRIVPGRDTRVRMTKPLRRRHHAVPLRDPRCVTRPQIVRRHVD